MPDTDLFCTVETDWHSLGWLAGIPAAPDVLREVWRLTGPVFGVSPIMAPANN